MEPKHQSRFVRAVSRVWRAIDWTRRIVFGVLALFLVALLLAAIFSPKGPKVPKSTILVVRPEGQIVEQLSLDPFSRAMRGAFAEQDHEETLLWDMIDAIQAAKDDERVKAIYLDLNKMQGAQPAMLGDLKQAIQEFKKTGKKVIAAADMYTAGQYYLAAQADEVYLESLGLVLLQGLGRYRTYYKDGLDRLQIEMNVIRVGEYKSAVEPFLRNDMSAEDRQSSEDWMGDLWHSMVTDMATARQLKPEDLDAYTANARESLRKVGGDTAKLALDAKLVDHVGPRDDVRKRLIEIAGEDEETHSYYEVGCSDYLEALGKDRTQAPGAENVVAVVVAAGEIVDGSQPPGTIGGDSTAELIRKARNDDKTKAIVLRVDSPGGSAFASELIREECAKARAAGKPVIVSMGGVAASGGYWISTSADEIFASADTITGSIGIFGMLPTVEKPLAQHLGVHADGFGTTWLAGAYSPDRALDPNVRDLMQMLIERGYQDFLTRVAEARQKTPEEIDTIARGRVWSGADAQKIGLVDELGNLNAATAAAAKRAKLGEDYKVRFVEKELPWQQKLLVGAVHVTSRFVGPVAGVDRDTARSLALLARVAQPLTELSRAMSAGGVFAYCPECVLE